MSGQLSANAGKDGEGVLELAVVGPGQGHTALAETARDGLLNRNEITDDHFFKDRHERRALLVQDLRRPGQTDPRQAIERAEEPAEGGPRDPPLRRH